MSSSQFTKASVIAGTVGHIAPLGTREAVREDNPGSDPTPPRKAPKGGTKWIYSQKVDGGPHPGSSRPAREPAGVQQTALCGVCRHPQGIARH